ncbi:uncharacterized protein [Fopius arisanus]|uniref:Uncharacterized protein isoform X3 n=1 Tax=Fopius arisanus TaxID=64838 RepID=A0A9R1TIX0_9HYME|nr:PREDICTED: uncharacterized protein LOC105270498 isoform X3 [Fopius arisanus]
MEVGADAIRLQEFIMITEVPGEAGTHFPLMIIEEITIESLAINIALEPFAGIIPHFCFRMEALQSSDPDQKKSNFAWKRCRMICKDHSHELAMMRRKPIAEIINLSLILEDPWRKLINNSRNYTAEREKSESNLLITPEKVDIPLQDGLHKDNRHNESSTEGHWRLR